MKNRTAMIRRIGLQLADKKARPFDLHVDWIRSYSAESHTPAMIAVAV